jgi:hypothetical protein
MRALALWISLVAALPACDRASAGPKAPPEAATGKRDAPMPSAPQSNNPDDAKLPHVKLLAAPRYFLGLPLVVSVTFENRSRDTEFYLLPPLDLTFSRGGDLTVTFVPVGDSGKALTARFPKGEEDEEGFELRPGEKQQRVCDLSNLGISLEPGVYSLTLTLRSRSWSEVSNPVKVELLPLSDADAQEAARLRRLGKAPFDTGAWAPFLRDNWNTVEVSPAFDPEARKQLELHLFLHRALYGPDPLAALDLSPLTSLREPHIEGEVAALRYELLRARKDPNAKAARSALVQGFPELEYRAQAVDRGEGPLASCRKAFGAERQLLRPPASWPYKP